jgi:hypothetical protein
MAASSSHLSGGSTKRMRQEEEAGGLESTDPSIKRRRTEIIPMDVQGIRDCVLLNKSNIEWRSAIRHIKRCVLDGGLQVKLGKTQLYPGYDEDSEKILVENLERALEWRLTLGFVLVMMRRRPIYKLVNMGMYDSDDDDDSEYGGGMAVMEKTYNDSIDKNQGGDAMDIDPSTLAVGNEDGKSAAPRIELDKEDIEFVVPSLGYGQFRTFLDLQQYKYKVDYIRTEDEKKDDDLACFVFTEEEPIRRYKPDVEGESTITAMPSSPAGRLVFHARILDNFIMADEKGTKLATSPIPVAQERPPAKVPASLAAGSEYNYAGGPGAINNNQVRANSQQEFGKPHVTFTPKPPDTPAAPKPSIVDHDVKEVKDHTYYIEQGYVYAGLVTPHAYPRISDRRTDYVTLVSTETCVPAHVIQPGKTTSGSSSGMAGASAGTNKNTQAAGSKQASSGQEKSSGSNGFSADPSFNIALEMRDFLQNFFQTMMGIKNGEKLRQYSQQTVTTGDHDLKLKQALVDDLTKLIAEAEKGLVNFTDDITGTLALDKETRQLEAEAQRDAFKPENLAKANEPTEPGGKPRGAVPLPTPSSEGKSDGGNNIPAAPEVEALTKRRLQIQNDMRAISDAIEQQRKMESTERPVSLVWRQPIINDTSNIENVIRLLGLTPEQSHNIAMRRLGLNS